MRFKVIILVSLLFYCCCFQSIFARPKTATPIIRQTKVIIVHEELVGNFKVKSGHMVVLKGKQENCREDNRFVVSVVQQQRVKMDDFEYEVAVRKLVTKYIEKEGKERLIVYQYTIECKPGKCNLAYNRLLQKLHTTIIGDFACIYEAPVVCYYLEKQGKLVLLSHYGVAETYKDFEPNDLIDWVKKAPN